MPVQLRQVQHRLNLFEIFYSKKKNRVQIIGYAMDENNLKKVLSSSLVIIGSDGTAVAPYGKLAEGKPHPRYCCV